MASSAYWRRLEKEAWNKYNKYKDNYSDVVTIREKLSQPSFVQDVNKMIGEVVDDMSGALKGSNKFTANRSTISEKKLLYYGSEPKLSSAYNSLSSELSDLARKRDKAYEDYERYRWLRQQAEQAEASES